MCIHVLTFDWKDVAIKVSSEGAFKDKNNRTRIFKKCGQIKNNIVGSVTKNFVPRTKYFEIDCPPRQFISGTFVKYLVSLKHFVPPPHFITK